VTDYILMADQVRYQYPGSAAAALQELTLRLPRGKRTAICGHNGSGKSTFFLHAIGILRPASGRMLRNHAELSYKAKELKELREKIGLVFQDPEQQLILSTPAEDISYGLRNAELPEEEIRSRTRRVMASMGLERLADTPIHQLSLGQKKRVALAGVLVLNPELLLLDEPTAYLDRASERQLLQELDRIHREGVTVAMATHDMNLAYSWADWVLVLDGGRCVMEGPPHTVFQEEKTLHALGLELPLLLEIWRALPEAVRRHLPEPRSIEELKAILGDMDTAKAVAAG
jgi:cobalt/nickel transport system ATP-binding protein